ncbi:MAG: ATP-binding protein, partial [Pseudomonadota bacterium]
GALGALDHGLAIFDTEDRLLVANDRFRDLIRLGRDAVRPGMLYEDILRAAIADGSPVPTESDAETWIAERLSEHRAGTGWTTRLINGRWQQVYNRRTAGGWHVSVRMDVTAAKAREGRLEEVGRVAEERLSVLDTVLEHIGVGVHLVDRNRRLRYVNSYLGPILGLPGHPPEVGQTVGDLFDAHDAAHRARLEEIDNRLGRLAESVAGGQPETAHAPNGATARRSSTERRRVHFGARAAEVIDTTLPTGHLLSTYRDVTAQDRLEAELAAARDVAEASSQAKSTFLATISHEIRTPMNAVLGMAVALAETDLCDEQRKMVSVILNSSDVLHALLSDVLDIARADAGALALEERPFRMDELILPLTEVYRQRSAEKGLGFECTLDLSGGRVAQDAARLGDPLRLRQILDNLLSNALKFTPSGRIGIRVEARGDDLHFTVSDTGPGIPPADRDRLFEPFAQADASVARLHGGSGLGLSICRQLVEAMGGRIEIGDAEGGGARVEVLVPAPAAPIAARNGHAGHEPAPWTLAAGGAARHTAASCGRVDDQADGVGVPRGLRVLVAEDVETNRLVLGYMLQAIGAEVDEVESGAEAVRAASESHYDVLLMDMMMPDLSGVEATRRIRSREAGLGCPRVPIIAITATAAPDQLAVQRDAGVDDHVLKPIRPEVLRAALTRLAPRH